MESVVAQQIISAMERMPKKLSGADAVGIIVAWLKGLGYQRDQWGKYRVNADDRWEIGDRVLRHQKRTSDGRWFNVGSTPLVDAALNLATHAAKTMGVKVEAVDVAKAKRTEEKERAVSRAEEKKIVAEAMEHGVKHIAARYPTHVMSYLLGDKLPDEIFQKLKSEQIAYRAEVEAMLRAGKTLPAEDSAYVSADAPPVVPVFLNIPYRWDANQDGTLYTVVVSHIEKGRAVITIGKESSGMISVDPYSLRIKPSFSGADVLGDGYLSATLSMVHGRLSASIVLVISHAKRKGVGTRLLKLWCRLMAGYGIKEWVAIAAGEEGMPFLEALALRRDLEIVAREGSNLLVRCLVKA